MTNKIKVKRGIVSDNSTIILDSGEMFYDTSTKKLYIGDGVTQLGQLEPINSSGSGGGKIINTMYNNYLVNQLSGTISITIEEVI